MNNKKKSKLADLAIFLVYIECYLIEYLAGGS